MRTFYEDPKHPAVLASPAPQQSENKTHVSERGLWNTGIVSHPRVLGSPPPGAFTDAECDRYSGPVLFAFCAELSKEIFWKILIRGHF